MAANIGVLAYSKVNLFSYFSNASKHDLILTLSPFLVKHPIESNTKCKAQYSNNR